MASVPLPLLGIGIAAALVLLAESDADATRPGIATADLVRTTIVATPPQTDRLDRRTVHRSPDGLFYVDGMVNKQTVRFVVDTGATVTVLSPEDAARIGARTDGAVPTDDMETAGGPTEMKWSKPTEIRVAGHVVRNVHTALPVGAIRTSLLGQDVLSQLDSLTLRGDSLTLQ